MGGNLMRNLYMALICLLIGTQSCFGVNKQIVTRKKPFIPTSFQPKPGAKKRADYGLMQPKKNFLQQFNESRVSLSQSNIFCLDQETLDVIAFLKLVENKANGKIKINPHLAFNILLNKEDFIDRMTLKLILSSLDLPLDPELPLGE